jgi:hypothetical protein
MLWLTSRVIGSIVSLLTVLPAGGGPVGVQPDSEEVTRDWLCLIAPWLCS